MKVAALQRSEFVKAEGYRRKWIAYEKKRRKDKDALPPDRKLELEPLAEVLAGRRTVHFHTHRADDILTVLRLKREFRFDLVIQHGTEAYKVIDQIAAAGFHPRQRPAVTTGITERINTGEGKIYVTINEDEHGICEVFSTIGKAGGNAAAQSEAISRLISIALRSGVDPQELIRELKGISGPNPVWENGELILSTPDAIGKAIERYVQRNAGQGSQVAEEGPAAVSLQEALPPSFVQGSGSKTMTTCPECGSTVAHENSCLMCKHCGWSKC